MAEKPPDNIIRPSRFSSAAGGSGPRDPGMEARISALEAAVSEIRVDLKAIRLDLAEMKGKLSNVPTTFQLVFMQAGLILAIFPSAFGLLKLASLH